MLSALWADRDNYPERGVRYQIPPNPPLHSPRLFAQCLISAGENNPSFVKLLSPSVNIVLAIDPVLRSYHHHNIDFEIQMENYVDMLKYQVICLNITNIHIACMHKTSFQIDNIEVDNENDKL